MKYWKIFLIIFVAFIVASAALTFAQEPDEPSTEQMAADVAKDLANTAWGYADFFQFLADTSATAANAAAVALAQSIQGNANWPDQATQEQIDVVNTLQLTAAQILSNGTDDFEAAEAYYVTGEAAMSNGNDSYAVEEYVDAKNSYYAARPNFNWAGENYDTAYVYFDNATAKLDEATAIVESVGNPMP